MSFAAQCREQTEELHDNAAESAYDILLIPARHIGDIWNSILPHLIAGMSANPNMSIRDIAEGLTDQSIQLWVVAPKDEGKGFAGSFLTSIERDKGEWVLSLYGLGGKRPKEWVKACDETMHRFAAQEDAKRVRMCGRPAWQRILPGYTVVGERQGHLVYEKAVMT